MPALVSPFTTHEPYAFNQNDPFDHSKEVIMVVPQIMSSRDYMRSIRDFRVPTGALALWYLGQNGFLLKDSVSPLIAIDLYLTNSCAALPNKLSYRLDRQLPIFIEPEDLDVDIFLTTHSHQDHADPETIRRVPQHEHKLFVGPFDSMRIYKECGVHERACRLLHPGQTLELGATSIQATFAFPTDNTDLNHTGVLITFSSGITFYNTGDTAWAERLPSLLPTNVDICTVCINGGYHNLAPEYAAQLVQAVAPKVAIPCHYDMMINNVGSPSQFRAALERTGAASQFHMLRYYEPWLYQLPNNTPATTTTKVNL
jgi:L-ascorbate 6-phosphate lactonase